MITFLNVLGVVLLIVEVFAVSTLVLIGVDMAAYYFLTRPREIKKQRAAVKTKESVMEMLHKEKLRREKEEAAHEGFFEDSYVRGFDASGALVSRGVKVPTAKAWAYYQQMDKLADTQIFENTEEL